MQTPRQLPASHGARDPARASGALRDPLRSSFGTHPSAFGYGATVAVTTSFYSFSLLPTPHGCRERDNERACEPRSQSDFHFPDRFLFSMDTLRVPVLREVVSSSQRWLRNSPLMCYPCCARLDLVLNQRRSRCKTTRRQFLFSTVRIARQVYETFFEGGRVVQF